MRIELLSNKGVLSGKDFRHSFYLLTSVAF